MSESTQSLGLIGSLVIKKTPTIKLNKNIQGVPQNMIVARRLLIFEIIGDISSNF